jgi:hypothetical protein
VIESESALRSAACVAGTDWPAIFTSAPIPLTVAAGFVYFAFVPSEFDDWARGLLVLIPAEYFRAFVFSILSETYREYRTPRQAVQVFLTSLAILIVIAAALSLYVLKGDWWAWISQPQVYRRRRAVLTGEAEEAA